MKKLLGCLFPLFILFSLASCTGNGQATPSVQSSPIGQTQSTIEPTKSALEKTRSAIRQTRYYVVDRVKNDSDYATLAAWGINTAIVQFDIHWKPATWEGMFQAARDAGINLVVWPSDWTDKRADCDSGSPFPVTTDGDISKVKPLLDVASTFSNFIGIVSAHEWMWKSCPMTLTEMAGLKTKLKDYLAGKGRPDVKVWNYTNSLESGYESNALPDDQITRIMDVAVIWKHCAGEAEGTCDASLARIKGSRARIKSLKLDGQVELVYLIQTFVSTEPYTGRFTLSQLETFGCHFLSTSTLDGFGFYTWDAGWWDDLHSWSDLQPAVPYIHSNCTGTMPSP